MSSDPAGLINVLAGHEDLDGIPHTVLCVYVFIHSLILRTRCGHVVLSHKPYLAHTCARAKII